ncbi:MAG: translation initiation factor IF-3, partial [Phycisphaerae bacterium]
MIGPENEQFGIVPTAEAMQRARDAGMDLVEVAGNVRPPVCRIMDFGKWKYHQKKHQKKSHEQVLKEVRIRPKTDDHDRQIKVNRAIKFFQKGDKVQFTMMFRGRERAHREIGFATFREIIEEFGDRVKVERAPGMDGRNMMMILAPAKGAFEEDAKKPTAKPADAKANDGKKGDAKPVDAAADHSGNDGASSEQPISAKDT